MSAVDIEGDSATVIGWANGEISIKSDYLQQVLEVIPEPLHAAWTYLGLRPRIRTQHFAFHVYREFNKEADKLANHAIQFGVTILMSRKWNYNRNLRFIEIEFDGGHQKKTLLLAGL